MDQSDILPDLPEKLLPQNVKRTRETLLKEQNRMKALELYQEFIRKVEIEDFPIIVEYDWESRTPTYVQMVLEKLNKQGYRVIDNYDSIKILDPEYSD